MEDSQQVAASTIAREKMQMIIHLNSQAAADAQVILDLIEAKPELDEVFSRLFGIRRPGEIQKDLMGR